MQNRALVLASACAALALWLAWPPAWARAGASDCGREIIRDAQGRRLGVVEPGVGGRQVIRDSQGRRVGTVERGPGGQRIIRDAQGRYLGAIVPSGR